MNIANLDILSETFDFSREDPSHAARRLIVVIQANTVKVLRQTYDPYFLT